MPKTRPPYPPELRRRVVELVRAGRDPEDLAREFEPTAQSIRAWVSQAERAEGRREAAAPDALSASEREELARHKDISPGRLLPDSALVAVAQAMPRSVPQLLRTPGFHGRAASKEAPRWLRALSEARQAEELVPQSVSSDSLPPVKSWMHRQV